MVLVKEALSRRHNMYKHKKKSFLLAINSGLKCARCFGGSSAGKTESILYNQPLWPVIK